MVKKSENLEKAKKSPNSVFSIFFSEFFGFAEKNICYPLNFPILGGSNLNRPLQSSPFQKYENLNKSQKITYFHFFLQKKYAIFLFLPIKEISF